MDTIPSTTGGAPKSNRWLPGTILLIGMCILAFAIYIASVSSDGLFDGDTVDVDDEFTTFASAEELRSYLDKASSDEFSAMMPPATGITSGVEFDDFSVEDVTFGSDRIKPTSFDEPKMAVERYSTTNVQVAAVDEPDIVKNTGDALLISSEASLYAEFDDSEDSPGSLAVNTLPVDDIAIQSEFDTNGSMVLNDDRMVMFEADGIQGFNITNPLEPEKAWKYWYPDDARYYTARMYDDSVYVVTVNKITYSEPCPFVALQREGEGSSVEIACNEIYHPTKIVPVETIYTVTQIDASSGNIKESLSFVGSEYSTVVYMSEENMYLAYNYPPDMFEMLYDFLSQEASEVMPQYYLDELKKINEYDISEESKMVEFDVVMEKLEDEKGDELDKLDDIMDERFTAFFDEHGGTAIIKLSVSNLQPRAAGTVPGFVLNQFSLDEYDEHLRVVTTVGDWFGFGSEETVNDLYVLDKKLRQTGSVLDMGAGEQIYSARFVEDKGYMVTFQQIDPFFVFDLSDPNNPQKVGELKIPGFSSYLHPLTDELIIGVGEEGGSAKVSLFNVKNPSDPQEVSKYELDAWGSEVSWDHHAFLHDAENKIIFLPAGSTGYILSYADNNLTLTKEVDIVRPRRAMYVNEYLYIVGEYELVVFSQDTWEEVSRIQLSEEPVSLKYNWEFEDIAL